MIIIDGGDPPVGRQTEGQLDAEECAEEHVGPLYDIL